MPVLRPLLATEYLASHPQDINITFSFPDGRQLGANRMLLSASCDVFQTMLSGDWKEESIIQLPDTNLEAFQLFTKILYAESVDLNKEDIVTLDQLYYLADKYMIEEIKLNITDAASGIYADRWPFLEELSYLEHMKMDPTREIFTQEIIEFLDSHRYLTYLGDGNEGGAVKKVEDLSRLANLYFSGKFSENIMEMMVRAAVFFLEDPDKDGLKLPTFFLRDVYKNIPETEESVKFMFKVMKSYGQSDCSDLDESDE